MNTRERFGFHGHQFGVGFVCSFGLVSVVLCLRRGVAFETLGGAGYGCRWHFLSLLHRSDGPEVTQAGHCVSVGVEREL